MSLPPRGPLEGSSGPPRRSSSRLTLLGWDDRFDAAFANDARPGLVPARVAVGYGVALLLYAEQGELTGTLGGRLRRERPDSTERPVVGDWVVARPLDRQSALVEAVLPRRTSFVRKAPGGAVEAQVVAANLDTILLLTAVDHDFNPRRLERYLVLAHQSGAQPVVVLSKADLSPDLGPLALQAAVAAPGVPIVSLSSRTGRGLTDLDPYLQVGRTVALLGSSGVGKSSLVNALLGEARQRTAEVRTKDSRGRHTTTRRELISLGERGLLLDTPGLREVQLWLADSGHQAAFSDVEQLSASCRFRDCRHGSEPGCAVRGAVAAGELSSERLDSFERLERELRHLETRVDPLAERTRRREVKASQRAYSRYQKER